MLGAGFFGVFMTVYLCSVGTAGLIAVGFSKIFVVDVRATNAMLGRHNCVSLCKVSRIANEDPR